MLNINFQRFVDFFAYILPILLPLSYALCEKVLDLSVYGAKSFFYSNIMCRFNIILSNSFFRGCDGIEIFKQRCTRGYKRYKEWKECQIFHSIFT